MPELRSKQDISSLSGKERSPDACFREYGRNGAYLAAIADILARLPMKKYMAGAMANAAETLAGKYRRMLSDGNTDGAARFLYEYYFSTAQLRAEADIFASVCSGSGNPYEETLRKAGKGEAEALHDYGIPIKPVDLEMYRFWFSVPRDQLRKMAVVIADAFLHGFVSQSRDRRGRKTVRFHYQAGQEALAIEVMDELIRRGLVPVVLKPQFLDPYDSEAVNHMHDMASVMDRNLLQEENSAWENAINRHEKELSDVCGTIRIEQFGAELYVASPDKHVLRPAAPQKRMMNERDSYRRELEASVVKPSDISFCKAAFPNLLVGNDFEKVFWDYFALNLTSPEPYEAIQQKLIETLDQCKSCVMKGYNGNETDLAVAFFKLSDPSAQTKFLNCGGDLNIPYGEVFTTPMLEGTDGVLHIPVITLQHATYHNLRLRFRNGWIADASCDEGAAYLAQNLFGTEEDLLPAGEFAIGTNTQAYSISEKYDLAGRLPILIHEKMGPHIAIGDPCFAHAEDAPIYNLADHKEMVCRENEWTRQRDVRNVYFGKHIDITIPYKEVRLLAGIMENGRTVDIIRNGRFVLPGTDKLNDGFRFAGRIADE